MTTTKNLYAKPANPKVGAGAEVPAPPSTFSNGGHPKIKALQGALLAVKPEIALQITFESYADPITPQKPRVRLYKGREVFFAGDIDDAIQLIKSGRFAEAVSFPITKPRPDVYKEGEFDKDQIDRVFRDMLAMVTKDGATKLHIHPVWWKDPQHLWKLFNHLRRYFQGDKADRDSGAHPMVHVAWRALCLAYQETQGKINPQERINKNGLLEHGSRQWPMADNGQPSNK